MKWANTKVIESTNENVRKYVFEKDDAVAEAVLYRYPTYQERTVICCSTQSGCPVGCRFCGAGDRFVRSLKAAEIVSQVVRLVYDTGVSPAEMQRFQIMFMSMGEPMLNWPQLNKALRTLYDMYPKAALLISTSGPRVDYAGLAELSVEIPTIGLQFSVHESTDEARDRLIPFRNKMRLDEIAWTGNHWHRMTDRRPFFNYCAHEGNVAEEDAERLSRLFAPSIWEATVSVVCERDEHVAAANERQRELAESFMVSLTDLGYSTRMFDPAGQDDIGGGCGQLWFVQRWISDNSAGRLSVGAGLPMVHTPQARR